MTDSNVEAVREKLLQRSERGIQKYGVTTERSDLSAHQWLAHLQEELLDAAVYIEALLQPQTSGDAPPNAEADWREMQRRATAKQIEDGPPGPEWSHKP